MGEESRSKFYFTWSVDAPVIEEPVAAATPDAEPDPDTESETEAETTPEPVAEPRLVGVGSFELNQSGSYFAKSFDSVYIADPNAE